MIHARDLQSLIARAKSDGARAFFYKNQDHQLMMTRAIETFPRIPYPMLWFVYRKYYELGWLDIKQKRSYTTHKRSHRG